LTADVTIDLSLASRLKFNFVGGEAGVSEGSSTLPSIFVRASVKILETTVASMRACSA